MAEKTDQRAQEAHTISHHGTTSGIKLVPQPSDDPRDPLNWPTWKKFFTLAIVSYASFVSITQATCWQSDFPVQAKSYTNVTVIEMSYTLSASIAGLASGPIFWLLLIGRIGEGSCILWGTVLALVCTIWAGFMTGSDQYVAFAISRWLGATFGSAATIAGAGTILDIFFLHQRGWAFAAFGICTLFGIQFASTTSGYVVEFSPWPVQFWWTAGAEVSVILLVFFCMPHTSFPRSTSAHSIERSYVDDRIAMFFPGNKVVYADANRTKQSLVAPFAVLVSPVTLISGFFLFVCFGWIVAVSTLLAVFLQSPESQGGYALSPLGNADFTFCQWGGVVLAEVYLIMLQDKAPLWLCRRRGGIWAPEYRLITLCPLIVLLCIGLAIFGASLQYHLSIGTLGVGTVFIYWGGIALPPIMNNYLAESFTSHPMHAAAALNFYRTTFGLAVPFFIDAWTARVGIGWVFGMMAFFSLFAFGLLGLLVWQGTLIRSMSFAHLQRSEEGEVVQSRSRPRPEV